MKELNIAATVENIETVTDFVNEQHVIFDVKGTLPKEIVDARL